MSQQKSDALIAIEALASLQIGRGVTGDESLVLYRNGGSVLTVGHVLAAQRAVSKLIWWQSEPRDNEASSTTSTPQDAGDKFVDVEPSMGVATDWSDEDEAILLCKQYCRGELGNMQQALKAALKRGRHRQEQGIKMCRS